jgi:hypothetical protein
MLLSPPGMAANLSDKGLDRYNYLPFEKSTAIGDDVVRDGRPTREL